MPMKASDPGRAVPEAPELHPAAAEGLVQWLGAMASWLTADHAAARATGQEVTGQDLHNVQLSPRRSASVP